MTHREVEVYAHVLGLSSTRSCSRFLSSWRFDENQPEERNAIVWEVWNKWTVFVCFLANFGRSRGTELNSQMLPSVSYNRVRWFRPDSQWLNGKTWQHWTPGDTKVSYRCQAANEGFGWRLSPTRHCDWLMYVPGKVKRHKETNKVSLVEQYRKVWTNGGSIPCYWNSAN
jgi:hypothetical protein